MFERRFQLFKLFGFNVKADTSWFIIVFLLLWTLSYAYFPNTYPDLTLGSYILLGLVGAIGLFLSIIAHEFCHALAAKRFGLPMRGITLWVFGGVAEMDQEPDNAKQEFYMAAAGPLASFVLAGVFYGLTQLPMQGSVLITAIFTYLWQINLVLAIFNLIPAFPLDGGRILRSLLWQWKGRIKWATKISANIGSGFGIVLMILGALGFLSGDLIGGIWYFFIGLFIRWAAKMSYTRLRINQALEDEPVRKFMGDIHTIPQGTTITDAIENYMYKYQLSSFPVIDNNSQILGILNTQAIRKVPTANQQTMTVDEILVTDISEHAVEGSENAADVLSTLTRKRDKSLVITEGGVPVGTVDLEGLLKVVALKLELSGDEEFTSPDIKFHATGH